MSYHLKLAKALSYCGVVKATQQHPDVFVEDKATADEAVATGYFNLLEGDEETPEQIAHLDRAQLESMKQDELKKLAADMGIDTKGFKKNADYIEAIAAAEITPGPAEDEENNEVDYGEGGSPTMIDLQEQK